MFCQIKKKLFFFDSSEFVDNFQLSILSSQETVLTRGYLHLILMSENNLLLHDILNHRHISLLTIVFYNNYLLYFA